MACLHDHSCEDRDCSTDWSIYKHIDLSKVSLLNLFHFSSSYKYQDFDSVADFWLYFWNTQIGCFKEQWPINP